MDPSTDTPQGDNQTFNVIGDEPLQATTETPTPPVNPLNTGNGTPTETKVNVVSKDETPHEIKLDSIPQEQSKTEGTFAMGTQNPEPAKKSSLFKSYGIPVIVVVGLTILGLAGYYIYTIYSEPEIAKEPEKPKVELKKEEAPAKETPAETPEAPAEEPETPSVKETPATDTEDASITMEAPPSLKMPTTDAKPSSTKIPRH